MQDEQNKQPEEDQEVEAHHFKTGPSVDEPERAGLQEDDDDVEAHHWKASPTEKLIGGDETRVI